MGFSCTCEDMLFMTKKSSFQVKKSGIPSFFIEVETKRKEPHPKQGFEVCHQKDFLGVAVESF